MEKWQNKEKKKIVSLICVWLGGQKSGGMKKFCLVKKKNEKFENRICIKQKVTHYTFKKNCVQMCTSLK